MATTPEGRVKDKIKAILREHGAYTLMPVQAGYGIAALDFHGCHWGVAFFIEAKAANKQMTPRQKNTAKAIEAAGGRVFLINEATGTEELEQWLADVMNAQL